MIKTDWSITSEIDWWTRQDFLFTYSDAEKWVNTTNKKHSDSLLEMEFIKFQKKYVGVLSIEENLLVSFFEFYQWGEFYYDNKQYASMLWVSESTIQRLLKSLGDKWYLDIVYKKVKWLWTMRKVRFHHSEVILTDVEKSNWPVYRSQIDPWYIDKENKRENNINIHESNAQWFMQLWDIICTKKWGDESIGAKEYEKKIAQWVDAEDMIKSASLDKFEIREWICDITYTKNKQNWIKTYTKQSEDVIESRIISILRARYERYLKWTKFRENTVTDLQELFWKEYISWLWKFVQQQYKEQHF